MNVNNPVDFTRIQTMCMTASACICSVCESKSQRESEIFQHYRLKEIPGGGPVRGGKGGGELMEISGSWVK